MKDYTALPDFQARMEESRRRVERDMGIEHKDGIPWNKAETPPWDHVCWPQTRGYVRMFDLRERCACGAVRMDGPTHPWIEINQTRKRRGETEPLLTKVRRPLRAIQRDSGFFGRYTWNLWFTAAMVVGWCIGALPLWLFDWADQIGWLWSIVLTQATMWGLAVPVAFWAQNRQYRR